MINFTLRHKPQESDPQAVEKLIKNTGFFNQEEIKISSSLVIERIQQGEESGYFFTFLDIDNTLTGYTCYGPIPGTESSFDLYWIGVDKTLQKEGLGTILLEETEKEVIKMKGSHIYIETSSTELYFPTRKFYEKCGYFKECEISDYYKTNDNLVIYSKNLMA